MSAETRLDEVLSRWQNHQARGEEVSAAELCRECPELLPEVRRRLRALQQLDQMAASTDSSLAAAPSIAMGTPRPAPLSPAGDEIPARPADAPLHTAAAFATRYAAIQSIGRFQVQKLLGEGGFAKVYLAYDPELQRQVALKVPHVSYDRLDLLRREARLAANLRHPAIVQIYEICSHSTGDPKNSDPPVYLVMQYIEGVSLAKKLEAEKVSRDEAVDLMLAVADAVSYAHGETVLHRDLKPHNILLNVNGRPYVTDFGLAVRQATLAAHVGEVYGTPAYMAPEQANGHELTPASDIWSLGVILYEMLVRQRPFGSHPTEVLRRLATEAPVRPTELDSTVPQDLERICLKCLARNPADRYASVHELIVDLRHWKTRRAVGPSEGDLQHADRYYKQAMASIDAGDLTPAMDRLQNAVQLNPDLAAAHYLLGLCCLLSDQEVARAIVPLKKATELNRDHDAAHFLLANVYYELNALQLAALHADQALATKPADQTYRDYQKQVRQKLGAPPASDVGQEVAVQAEIAPPRRRYLAELAGAVFHLAKARQLTLRHWATLHYPWRAIERHPFTGALLIAVGLYALCMLAQLFAYEHRRAVQLAVVYVIVWTGLYLPFVVARMLERTYVRLLPVVNMPEDAYRRFFIRQVAEILGASCTVQTPKGNRLRLSWEQDRSHLLTAVAAFLPLMGLQYVCANEPLWPLNPPRIALFVSAVIEVYVLLWIFPLGLSSIFFIPRFASIPLRYFLGMPDALSLASVGTFYVRIGWLACFGYFFFMLQHYLFRTFEVAPAASVAYIAVGGSWVIVASVISQYQLHKLLQQLKAQDPGVQLPCGGRIRTRHEESEREGLRASAGSSAVHEQSALPEHARPDPRRPHAFPADHRPARGHHACLRLPCRPRALVGLNRSCTCPKAV